MTKARSTSLFGTNRSPPAKRIATNTKTGARNQAIQLVEMALRTRSLFRNCVCHSCIRWVYIPVMSNQVTRIDQPGQTLLVIRRSFPPADIGKVLGEILPKVYEFAVSNGLAIAGAPVCCYKEWTKERATVEAGLPIAGSANPEGECILSSIPAGAYASVIHEGSYDTIDQAHQTIESWLQREGVRADIDVFEVYLTDPDEHPDPADWQTQVMRRLL